MERVPNITIFEDGSKIWEQAFEKFTAKVYLPVSDLPADIVNFGFRAPYLMIFTEKELELAEAKAFADREGFSEIASEFAGSVTFFYPACGSWEGAPKDLYEAILEESRISQYYQDGTAILYDRFAKKMGSRHYIRGAVHRTYLYGYGASADYLAENCLKRIEGAGLYGRGDVTPAGCILERLSKTPRPERRDLPVVSVANSDAVNRALSEALDHVRISQAADVPRDFREFVGTFRRMMGNLEREADLDRMGMRMEPGFATVKTTKDNRGDDRETTEHRIGYVAYFNRNIFDGGRKAPLLLCFHGGGDSAMCMATNSGWYRVAAKYGFLLVCVENHLNSTATETMELLEHLKRLYRIDEERVYASGFSMGGCKSWDMFQEYPKVFAAVAPMDATFEVGLNVFGEKAPVEINRDTPLPVFYAGGEITPLPELPFQEAKCLHRMQYVMEVNRTLTKNPAVFEEQEHWQNPIWGIDGDCVRKLKNEERENSVLTLQLFQSENDKCYCIFASISNQGHEVHYHGCENAWKFLSSFRRLPDGTLEGGDWEQIKALYQENT